jgi:type IV secretory pathway TraG/TraD family ATPase VirD4
VKARPTTVYLVLPPDRLATYARWLRLMLAQGLTDLARAGLPARPVLLCSMNLPRWAASNPSSGRWV